MLKFTKKHRSNSAEPVPKAPPRRDLPEISAPAVPPRTPVLQRFKPPLPPPLPEKNSYRKLSSGSFCVVPPRLPSVSSLKKKYEFQKAVEMLVEKLDLNLPDNLSEQESGYGSDLDSLSKNFQGAPPVPSRNLQKKGSGKTVRFDSYVLLLQGLRDRDSESVKRRLLEVNSQALLTEEVTAEFIKAILSSNELLVKELLRAGANSNAVESSTGLSALHLAASRNDLPIIKLLLLHGAVIFTRAPSSGVTPSELCNKSLSGYQAAFAYLTCMEECLGIAQDGLVFATRSYKSSRPDELSVNRGEAVTVKRRGDYPGSTWWWCSKAGGIEGYALQDILALHKPSL